MIVGAVLLALAAPRFGAAVAELPGRPVLEALERGQAVDDASRHRLAESAALSFAIVPTANAKRAEAAAVPGDATTQALALSPADPYGWLNVARIENSAQALSLSLRTGRWERELAYERIVVASRLLPDLDEATRNAITEQVLWLWDLDQPRLLRALPPEPNWPLYRRALSDRPEALVAVARRVGMD